MFAIPDKWSILTFSANVYILPCMKLVQIRSEVFKIHYLKLNK